MKLTRGQLEKITPWQEMSVIRGSKELRKHFTKLAEKIDAPAIYETDGNDEAASALHYFDTVGSADWYIFEADIETGEAFAFVTYSGEFDDPYAEFGYVNLFDIANSARINLDLHYEDRITKRETKERRYGKAAA